MKKRMETREDTDLGEAGRVYVWEGLDWLLGIALGLELKVGEAESVRDRRRHRGRAPSPHG